VDKFIIPYFTKKKEKKARDKLLALCHSVVLGYSWHSILMHLFKKTLPQISPI
jgi:hypothetical protein